MYIKPICIITNNCISYNKLKSGGNDPSITKAMRFSQLVKNSNYATIQPPKNIYPYKTPLFTTYFK